VRRALRFGAGWLAAAAAAVAVSWAVIADAVGPGGPEWSPGAAPAAAGPAPPGGGAAAASAGNPVIGTATARRTPGAPAPGRATPPVTRATATALAAGSPAPATSSSAPAATPSVTPAVTPAAVGSTAAGAGVQTYPVRGGQVVVRLGATSASLVSATPAPGCRVQQWTGAGWLRVDFLRDTAYISSVFVTWNGTAPTVRTTDY